jgi:outer membrane protein
MTASGVIHNRTRRVLPALWLACAVAALADPLPAVSPDPAGTVAGSGEPVARVLTFDQVLEQAWPVAWTVLAGREGLDAAGAGQRAAHARRLPGLGLEASTGWVSEVQEISLPGRTLSFGDGLSADLGLVANWTVYAGGALQAGEDAAEAEHRARRHGVHDDSLAVLGVLRASFLQALATETAAALADNARERLERHLEDVRGRRAAGLATSEDELAARGRLQGALQEQALRRGDATQAALELGQWCGTPGRAVRPAGSLDTPLAAPPDTAEPLPAEQALAARESGLQARVRQEHAAGRPRVEASAGWHLGRPGVDPVTNDWMDYGTAGLRLRWPLWDNGLVRQRTAELQAETRKLSHQRSELARKVSARQAAAAAQVESAHTAWQAAAGRSVIEEERLGLVEHRWREGLTSEMAWLDASDDLEQARQQQALAAARLRLAEAARLAAWGR